MIVTFPGWAPSRRGNFQLLPNINRSGHVLGSEDRPGSPIQLDNERAVRSPRDREIYDFLIEVAPEELAANKGMKLEISFAPGLFRLLDPTGRPWRPETATGADSSTTSPPAEPCRQTDRSGDATPTRIALLLEAEQKRFTKLGLHYYLEAQAFWGSPLVPGSDRTVTFRFLDAKDVELVRQAKTRGGDVTTADFVLLGDDAPPERLYVCDVIENRAAVADVRAAAGRARVPLSVVPIELNRGDSWLQDQFQVGYTQTRRGSRRVIVHLPRFVNDSSVVAGTPNLRTFTDTHFPADDVAVVKDLWRTALCLRNDRIAVTEGFTLFTRLQQVVRQWTRVDAALAKVAPELSQAKRRVGRDDLFRMRLDVDATIAQLETQRPREPGLARELSDGLLDEKVVRRELSSTLETIAGPGVRLTVTTANGSKEYEFDQSTATELNELYAGLRDRYGSANFGGNVEVSPPTSSAPYGTILTGSVTSPDLKALLSSRGTMHPTVEVPTTWLDVGHIDEIVAFATSRSGSLALLRAAPMLGLAILRHVAAAQARGALVTRLFRGKTWSHKVKPFAYAPILPPAAYKGLARSGVRYDLDALERPRRRPHAVPDESAFRDDRRYLIYSGAAIFDGKYAASMTVSDILALCSDANRGIDALYLSDTLRTPEQFVGGTHRDLDRYRRDVLPRRLDAVIRSSFRGAVTIPIPALFDTTDDLISGSTRALIPGTVNMQTLGRHVLVPRPFGPRMRVTDAIAVLRDLARERSLPYVGPNEAFAKDRALDRLEHWVSPATHVYRADLGRSLTPFDPEYQPTLREAVRSAESLSAADFLSSPSDTVARADLANHPVAERESLRRIASQFRDGFDEFRNHPVDYCKGDTKDAHPGEDRYEADLPKVIDKVRRANPGTFDADGNLISTDWTRLVIPEETVDIFELAIQFELEKLGLEVSWIDAWYYHAHGGGIHCGTNVIRGPRPT